MATKQILSRVQRQRAEALRRAREVLSSSGLMSQGAVDALDVIRVADYILSGVEYLDRPPAPQPDYAEQNRKAIEEELQLAESGDWLRKQEPPTGYAYVRPGAFSKTFTVEETGPKWFGEEVTVPGIPSAASREALRRLLGDDWGKLPEEPPLPEGRLYPSVRDMLDGNVPPSWGPGSVDCECSADEACNHSRDDDMPGRSAG